MYVTNEQWNMHLYVGQCLILDSLEGRAWNNLGANTLLGEGMVGHGILQKQEWGGKWLEAGEVGEQYKVMGY